MILSTLGICWTPSPHRQGGLGGIHQVVYGNIFLLCCTSFWPSLTGNRLKMILSISGTLWTL